MSLERDILRKHKIENRSKKNLLKCSFYTIFNFSTCLQFLIEIWHFVSHAHNTTFIRKNPTSICIEVDLSIRLQKYANAWSDNHISANECYDNIFFLYELPPATIIHVKISWYKLNVSSVAETLTQNHQKNYSLRCKYDNHTFKITRTLTFESQRKFGKATHSITVHCSTKCCHLVPVSLDNYLYTECT
jgi:hypothetical protein